jgi:hypothetical protein
VSDFAWIDRYPEEIIVFRCVIQHQLNFCWNLSLHVRDVVLIVTASLSGDFVTISFPSKVKAVDILLKVSIRQFDSTFESIFDFGQSHKKWLLHAEHRKSNSDLSSLFPAQECVLKSTD